MASRTGLLPRKEKETLLTPPLTEMPGRVSRKIRVASKKEVALIRCSSMPVAMGKILGSKMIFVGSK